MCKHENPTSCRDRYPKSIIRIKELLSIELLIYNLTLTLNPIIANVAHGGVTRSLKE